MFFVGLFFPVIGLLYYFFQKRRNIILAKEAIRGALWGIVLNLLFVILINISMSLVLDYLWSGL